MVIERVAIKLRIEFDCGVYDHLQGLVHQVGSLAGIVPIATHFGNGFLKLLQQSTFHQRLFQKLRQGEVELVQSTFAVKLIPKHLQESLFLVGSRIVGSFKVEDACINGGYLEPRNNILNL